ncbi:MAG TPA: hypothetical protein VHT92_06230 [Candidatus Cybelea sp.]|jgi:hypothetical protein|nr:hypothetical protein [Candidatus Cybelea sp.]
MIAATIRNGSDCVEYHIGEGRLPSGSTLGSPKAVAVIKPTGALARLYSCDAASDAFGTVLVRHLDRRTGIELRARDGHFIIAPERQEHVMEYPAGLQSRERIFLQNVAPNDATDRPVEPPGLYYHVFLCNRGEKVAEVRTSVSISFSAGERERVAARFDERLNGFVVHGEDERFVRVAAADITPSRCEATGDRVGILEFDRSLEPGERAELTIVLTFSVDGEEAARRNLASLPEREDVLARTQAYYRKVLRCAAIETPEPEVNRGVRWAKVNMIRSMLFAEQGWCIVNDPAETTHAVGRDTAWFAIGAAYIAPWFAAEALRGFFDRLTGSGMAVEWYDSRSGKTETDGLDINDATPLLLWAAWHHFCVTGDREFLQGIYPNILRAARCIVARRGAQGLIWCHAPGTGAHGIVGWRNALHGERLSGATTELNAECYGALRAVSLIAAELEETHDAEAFARDATELRAAIDEHLLDRSRNLYYLAIDEDGRKRTDVLADLVFPLLFGLASPDVAAEIIATLTRPEFWSRAGLRTVPRNAIQYAPDHASGLLGGVWAAPTFWLATSAASFDPQLIADALTVTFRHYAEDPLRYNTVPGQFSEWLHGETLTNGGMMLSPWFAPKYLWGAIEGLAGLGLHFPTLARRLPPAWAWIVARDVLIRGDRVSWFTVRMDRVTTYYAATLRGVDGDHHYEEDVTTGVSISGDDAVWVALRRAKEVAIFVGNPSERSITVSVTMERSLLPPHPRMRAYDSLAGAWSDRADFESATGWRVSAERKGFCILEFVEES